MLQLSDLGGQVHHRFLNIAHSTLPWSCRIEDNVFAVFCFYGGKRTFTSALAPRVHRPIVRGLVGGISVEAKRTW